MWAGCALMPACAVAAVRWLSRCGCRGTWAPAMLHRLALGVLPVPTVGSPRALGFAVLHANALAFGTTSCSLLEWCGYGLLVGALQAVNPTDLTVTPSYGDPNGSHVSIKVVSEMFEGLNVVKRHKLVYGAIWEELSGPIHAVDELVTQTPAEAGGK